MRLSNNRFSDYRLAVYVVVAAAAASGITFAVDRLTAPAAKVQANAPPSSGAVRQIPIARTQAADLGDPEGKLTPIYPTSPGKDLPIKDTPVIQAKPAATTTGNAGANGQTVSQMSAAPIASATPQAANACNVALCAASYRSFRESDCSYQPFGGPRRTCDAAPDTNAQAAAQPRRLPPPGMYDDDPRGAVVMESPEQRYDLRRNWIVEPQE